MYLKSIEIQGFKSFANKIEFKFHNGITAIVGPNGSGKSNVADAVRWVLGEQKVKQLRGASMQDVIFSGTELRRPLGSAYVAITLDNSDHVLPLPYEEVTVARRLYRSGESEYMINGAPVRLRDVQEAFYDTGIGKEGYSIIGQGQIDRILSDKPEDRRELFDEAAGIVKFKRRKAASLKKLESEKENLTRITDILTELARQAEPLEKQAQKTREFLSIKETLKSVDANIFLIENQKNMDRLSEMKEKSQIAGADLAAARAEYEETGNAYEEAQEKLDALEGEIDQTRTRISDADIVRSTMEADIRVCREQISSARSRSEHFMKRRDQLQERLEEQEGQIESLSGSKAAADEELDGIRSGSEKASADLEQLVKDIEEKSAALDHARIGVLDLIDERGSIKSRLASNTARAEQARARQKELEEALSKAQDTESVQEKILEDLQKRFETVTGEISECQLRQKDLDSQIAGKKSRLAAADEEFRKAQSQVHEARSRVNAIVNMSERYEGFGGAVRRVMEHKAGNPGLIGVVADLISTRKEYETAIDIALGGSIQNIVTEDEETARKMIGMLKKDKAGRATFLPLTAIKNAQTLSRKEVLLEKGVIGTADTLVTIDSRYRDVALSLLGRTVVVDTYQNAVSVSRKYRQSIRLVTLEGELFMPGGSISGGSFKNSSNLLGRRREIEELRAREAACQKAADQAEELIDQIKQERNALRVKADLAVREEQKKRIEQNTIRMNMISEREKAKEMSGSREEMKREQELLILQIEELSKKQAECQAELEKSLEAEKALGVDSTALEEELFSLQAREEAVRKEAADWKIRLEKALQQAGFEEQNLIRITEEQARLKEELSEVEASIGEVREEIREKNERIRDQQARLEASGEGRNADRDLLKELTGQKEGLGKKIRDLYGIREKLSGRITDLEKECLRFTSRIERLEEGLASMAAYMWETYELTVAGAAALRMEGAVDIGDLHRQADELKKQIRALGSINPNAIEEFREVNERYTFLKTQHDDLVEGARKLEGIIEELDESMRRQFRDQFSRIADEYNRVFRELFGGGSGKLELMEDADILQAGVRVIAQPPGKKLQNMMQLSGGEKALTAISLLFAIQNLKPSPFCLLDEIEAALDESNVGRFSGYLHKLTEHTQFIVITHRRGTMEEADRLYGITMQEKGISTLVSVDLVDDDLDD
ncbi:MAG: chromosome segregation protein SMC [Lachnospiraceae bacterium]|nr:chromosome segregation protein SMC [Lachnospiraceae bacterium]